MHDPRGHDHKEHDHSECSGDHAPGCTATRRAVRSRSEPPPPSATATTVTTTTTARRTATSAHGHKEEMFPVRLVRVLLAPPWASSEQR